MRDNKKKIIITQSHKIKIISFIKSKKFRSPEDRPYFEITKNYCSKPKKKKNWWKEALPGLFLCEPCAAADA